MKTRILILVALLSLWGMTPASATTLVRMSLEQLSQASSVVARGQVVSQVSAWNTEHTRIFTFTTVRIEQIYKGEPASIVVIQQLGGVVGDTQVRVAGTAFLRPWRDYVFFLEPAGSTSRFLLVGMDQGAHPVYRDPLTDQERVALPLGHLYSMRQAGSGRGSLIGPTIPFAQFRGMVASAGNAPIVIPRGTVMPIAIESAESQGARRVSVTARTRGELFPSPGVVIPAGSSIGGNANLIAGQWQIYWRDVFIRGVRAPIKAKSAEPEGTLRGRILVVTVR